MTGGSAPGIVNGEVSFWWHALAAAGKTTGPRAPLPASTSATEADVCVVGAGYTGLWTAYYLKRADPSLRVVVLEQRTAGYGASGRNGGWLTNEITGGIGGYRKTHGAAAVDAFQLAMDDAVAEVVRVAAAEGIDADVHLGGEYTVARGPAQLARLRELHASMAARAHTDVVWLDREEALARIAVAGTSAAVWHPHCARIHPAKLVLGLARTVEALGVEIYEGTRVTEIRPGAPARPGVHARHPVAVTSSGGVSARVVVRATEGFTADLAGLHRDWLPMNSSMVATAPLPPAVWDEIGWAGRETLGDWAHGYMYAQRTADDRIALGGRGAPYRYGSRTDTDGHTPESTVVALRRVLETFFPVLRDLPGGAPLDHVWSGVLGVPRDWHATVGLDRATGLAWAGGYVGTGVTATNLAGRTLRDLVLGEATAITALPWVGHRVRRWEPEPLRWLAVHGLYRAYGLADAAEARGSVRTPLLARAADVVAGRTH